MPVENVNVSITSSPAIPVTTTASILSAVNTVASPISEAITSAINESDQNNDVLICEGAAGCFIPSLIICKQGNKVWIAEGTKETLADSSLNESVGSDVEIVNDISEMDITESDEDGKIYVKDGVWMFESVYQRSDFRNINNRIYPRRIWENACDEKSPVQTTIRERAAIGLLEHPKDGQTTLDKEMSILTTGIRLNEKTGVVYGKGEILSTPAGEKLKALSRDRVKWGVSSRGRGRIFENGTVDPDRYKVITWDSVYTAGTPGAYPGKMNEKAARDTSESVDESADASTTLLDEAEKILDESWMQCDPETIHNLINVFGGIAGDRSPRAAKVREGIVRRVGTSAINNMESDTEVSIDENAVVDEHVSELQTKLDEAESQLEETEARLAEAREKIVRFRNEAKANRKAADKAQRELAAATELMSQQMQESSRLGKSEIPANIEEPEVEESFDDSTENDDNATAVDTVVLRALPPAASKNERDVDESDLHTSNPKLESQTTASERVRVTAFPSGAPVKAISGKTTKALDAKSDKIDEATGLSLQALKQIAKVGR